MIHFSKEDGVDIKEEQSDMDPDLYDEDMEDVRLDCKIERYRRKVLEENDGGVGGDKAILHYNRWDV